METIIRILHNLKSQLASRLGAKVPRAEWMEPSTFSTSQWQLQKSGKLELENRLEAHLNPRTPASVEMSWPSIDAWEISNALVTGDDCNVFLPDGGFLGGCPSLSQQPDRKIRRPISWLAKRIVAPCFLLGGRNFENHGHFMLHHLPRLVAAIPLLEQHGVRHLLLGNRRKRFHDRYIQALAGSCFKILQANPGTTLVDRLTYAPQLWSQTALASPDTIQALAKAFLRHVGSAGGTANLTESKPILISREDAPDRRLLNEKEIASEIERQWGSCLILQLSTIPFDEQIRIFNRAPLIVGALGQGFANLIASSRSLCLILDTEEHWSESYFSETFRNLALLNGNMVSRLFAGVPIQKKEHWAYPISKFRKELVNATAHWKQKNSP